MSQQTRLSALATRVGAEVKAVRETTLGGLTFVKLTQSAYDGLGSKDSNTVYFIVG